MIRILTDEPYRVNLTYDDLNFSLRDERTTSLDVSSSTLFRTFSGENTRSNEDDEKSTIRFLNPPAVDDRNTTRLSAMCKERFGDEWDIISIKSPGHVMSLVEEAQRIGLDLDSSNSTPLAVSNEHEWVLVFRHDVRTGGLFSSHMGWEEAKRSNPYNPNSNKYSTYK